MHPIQAWENAQAVSERNAKIAQAALAYIEARQKVEIVRVGSDIRHNCAHPSLQVDCYASDAAEFEERAYHALLTAAGIEPFPQLVQLAQLATEFSNELQLRLTPRLEPL